MEERVGGRWTLRGKLPDEKTCFEKSCRLRLSQSYYGDFSPFPHFEAAPAYWLNGQTWSSYTTNCAPFFCIFRMSGSDFQRNLVGGSKSLLGVKQICSERQQIWSVGSNKLVEGLRSKLGSIYGGRVYLAQLFFYPKLGGAIAST